MNGLRYDFSTPKTPHSVQTLPVPLRYLPRTQPTLAPSAPRRPLMPPRGPLSRLRLHAVTELPFGPAELPLLAVSCERHRKCMRNGAGNACPVRERRGKRVRAGGVFPQVRAPPTARRSRPATRVCRARRRRVPGVGPGRVPLPESRAPRVEAPPPRRPRRRLGGSPWLRGQGCAGP